jgi:hypothetical protein
MKQAKPQNDEVEIEGHFSPATIRAIAKQGHIEKLSITNAPLLTAKVARGFSALSSVTQLWLWCDVTRTAMRYVIAIPQLQILNILNIKNPGRLGGFASATSLHTFRCPFLSESDLLEISTCRTLREISVQDGEISPGVIEALLGLPQLEKLDLEATVFDDDMAKQISASTRLLSLDVGATRLTRKGLIHICKMRQLQALDLWATAIDESDLDLLSQLPKLEYLSIGDVEGCTRFNAETVLPRLARMSALQEVWLDGIPVNSSQMEQLESSYKKVRVT